MKCTKCGSELNIDRETGLGVCENCGKKYKISTIVRRKVCSVCHVDLIPNGAVWECPKCHKKYFISSKNADKSNEVNVAPTPKNDVDDVIIPTIPDEHSDNEEKKAEGSPSNTIESNDVISPESAVENVEISSRENDSSDDDVIDNVDVDITLPEPTSTTEITNDVVDVSDGTIVEPEKDVVEESKPIETSPESDKPTEKPIEKPIEKSIEQPIEKPKPNVEFVVSDDDIDDIIDDVSPTESKPQQTKNENFSVAKHSVLDDKKELSKEEPVKKVPEMPKLYDYGGNEYVGETNAGITNSPKHIAGANGQNNVLTGKVGNLTSLTDNKPSKKHSNGEKVVLAVILGILAFVTGIGSYASSLLASFDSLSGQKELFDMICKYLPMGFYAVFAVICFATTKRSIDKKRIGTIIGGLFGIAMVVKLVLSAFIPSEKAFGDFLAKNNNIVTYGIYACLVFGSFLMTVITCDSSIRRKANVNSAVFFAFSIIATIMLALPMITFEKPVNSPFIVNIDKFVLAIATTPLLSLIADKSA